MAERAEARDELIQLTVRNVDPVALDGAYYRAFQENLSRSEYLRQFLLKTFYDDGVEYRQMLQKRANLHV